MLPPFILTFSSWRLPEGSAIAASACAPHVEDIGFSYFGSRPEFMFTITYRILQQLKEKEKMAEDHQKVRSRPHHRQISLTIVSACKQVQA